MPDHASRAGLAADSRPRFTVLGASGFIGSHLVQWLRSQPFDCWAPRRDETLIGPPLGHVIYCAGVTSDFRRRPYDTVRAHVCDFARLLQHGDFESLLYLSSTRIYFGAASGDENATLRIDPAQSDSIYNISKAMGESLSLASGRNVRIARLATVYGYDPTSEGFLHSIIRDAVMRGSVIVRSALTSQRDYIAIGDVVRLLPAIATSGGHRVYNVASGINLTHAEVLGEIQRLTGCRVEIAPDAPVVTYPCTPAERIRDEFNFTPARLLHALPELIAAYRETWAK